MTPADLSRLLAPLHRRMMLAIGRAVLRAVEDTGGVQRLQLDMLSEETSEGVEHFQGYGFTASPLAGAEVIVVCVGGNRDNPIAIALDDRRFRPTDLAAGEVCMYSRVTGQRVHFKANGDVLVQSPTKVIFEAPAAEFTGDVTVAGDVSAGTVSLRTHVHGGVATGAGNSGMPTP